MENRSRGSYYCCIQYVFKKFLSKMNGLEMGNPLCKRQEFPKLSTCYVTNWELLLRMFSLL